MTGHPGMYNALRRMNQAETRRRQAEAELPPRDTLPRLLTAADQIFGGVVRTDEVRAFLPPDVLPALLSSVEDVARVAAAAGLEHTRSVHRGEVTRWVRRPDLGVDLRAETRDVDGALRVVLLVERTGDHHGLAWSAEWYWNGQGGGGIPLGPVWSAIQAARGKTGGES